MGPQASGGVPEGAARPVGGGWRPFRAAGKQASGALAQLVERLLCKQDVSGSSPLTSTENYPANLILEKNL